MGYVCGGYKLRGTAVCRQNFLSEDVLGEAVFGAIENELLQYDKDGTVSLAKTRLLNLPKMIYENRDSLQKQIVQLDGRLNNLMDCITPLNKDIITERMMTIRREKEKLEGQLISASKVIVEVTDSVRTTSRLAELAKDFKGLWKMATFEEKREFLSFMVDSVDVLVKKEKARIFLSHNYLLNQTLTEGENGEFFLLDGRGGPRQSKRKYIDVLLVSRRLAA